MRSKTERINQTERDYREMRLLAEIEQSPQISQRSLSRSMSIGLGMTNLLLRGFVQKGYLRVTEAGWRSWVYALTPDGVARKVRLTKSYIHRVLSDYRSVRETLSHELNGVDVGPGARVAVCGSVEVAELIFLVLKEQGVDEITFFSEEEGSPRGLMGGPALTLSEMKADAYDWVIVASLDDGDATAKRLYASGVAMDHVLAPFGAGE